MKKKRPLVAILAVLLCLIATRRGAAQNLETMRLGYSGTGLNNYVLEMGKRAGIFKKNGLDPRGGLRQQRFVTQPSAHRRHLRFVFFPGL